jgi:NitT/TauT family transport system ATP-binding protein
MARAVSGDAGQAASLITVAGICHSFEKDAGSALPVLEEIGLTLRENEIVSLLGRSGSGKSTLLRIIAGLIAPTRGRVLIDGLPVHGPADGVAMVFQTFALLPWLSVLENVEFGLEALALAAEQRRWRALEAIDLIGLDGFESAYPKELSGGMRQRVGFARALVVHPKLLLMDEPFSALDVLTAETLRTDLLDLWGEGRLPIRAILMVTHNIEEAVLMSDRILVMSSNPGRITAEIRVELRQPRNRLDPSFRTLVDQLYARMTAKAAGAASRDGVFPGMGVGMVLPRVSSNALSGLIEALALPPYTGRADLPVLAEDLHLETDNLLRLAEVLQLLRFAELAEGDIKLTEAGRRFAGLDVDARKSLFARHLVSYVPIVAHIKRVLEERSSHRAPMLRFQEELEDHMPTDSAEQTLRAAISLGRYAEVFAYDEHSGAFNLENPS